MKSLGGSSSQNGRFTYTVIIVLAMILVWWAIMSDNLTFGGDSSGINSEHVISYQQFTSDSSHYIPKYIWRTSKFPLRSMPPQIKTILTHCAVMNPDYTQIYMDDDDIQDFINKEYPQYTRQFNSLRPGAYKADIFRLLILYKHGGVYNDIGHEYLVPLSQILTHQDEFLAGTEDNKQGSFKHAMHNGMLAAYPANPLIKAVLEIIMEDVATCSYNADPLDLTGPAALGHAYNIWKANGGTSDRSPRSRVKFDDNAPRGHALENNMHIKTLSHDAQNHFLLLDGKRVINTKFDGYYELMYGANHKTKSKYDEQWRAKAVYDLTKTDCKTTGVAKIS